MRGYGMKEGKGGGENREALRANPTSAGATSGPCLGAKAGEPPLLHRPEPAPACPHPSVSSSCHLLSAFRGGN